MYSFSSRDDTIVFDEPLYAHYLYSTGIKHPGFNDILNKYECNGKKVIENIILQDYERPISFFKLMSHFIIDLDLGFLRDMQNIILIRDPLDVIVSYDKVIQEPSLEDIGVLYQVNILNYLKKMNTPCIVVDSKDILSNPKKLLKEICHRLKIDFDNKMLSWKKGPKDFDGIWAKYWYSSVHETEGFIHTKHKMKELSIRNMKLYEEALGYYNLLKKQSI